MYTGTRSGCGRRTRPARQKGLDDNHDGGLPPEIQAEIRAAAAEADRGRRHAYATPTHELLVRMLSVAMGEEVPPEYGPMIAAELGLGDADRRPPDGGARRASG